MGLFLITGMLLFNFNVETVMAENIVVTKSMEIKLEADAKTPSVNNAFLYVAFENQGSADISGLDIEILYYTKDNFLISKEVLEKALTEPIPSKEVKKYKLYLGNSVETSYEHAAYPFEQLKSLDHYEVQAVNIKADVWKKVIDTINPQEE